MRRFAPPLFVFAALACAACGGGTSIGPLGPAPVATASVTAAIGQMQASATPSPVGLMPSAMPTATASTPSTVVSASPVPSATAANAITCTDPMTGVESETWTLSGSALTITIPPYGTFAGTIAFPANSPTGTVIAEGTEQSNFNGAPESSPSDPGYAARHKDFFMTFRLSQTTTFTGGAATALPITLASTCLTSGTTYYLDTFAGSTFQDRESATASAGSFASTINVTPNPYPGGTYMNVVLSH